MVTVTLSKPYLDSESARAEHLQHPEMQHPGSPVAPTCMQTGRHNFWFLSSATQKPANLAHLAWPLCPQVDGNPAHNVHFQGLEVATDRLPPEPERGSEQVGWETCRGEACPKDGLRRPVRTVGLDFDL